MQGVTLGWVAEACGGTLRNAPRNRPVTGLALDSRRVRPGELFVALPGRRTDGHRFLPAAAAAGAAAALCCRMPAGLPAVVVKDPRRALGRIAAAYRRRFPRLLVAAVTGSSGKTSTKEMLARVLAVRYRVLQNEGNLNNDLGLPVTLGRLGREHTAAVLELGMNAPGEIRALARMAQPQIGVITNVGDAHHEFFRDRREVVRAKAELLAGLSGRATAVLNADDPLLARLRPRRRLTFGLAAGADVRVLRTAIRLQGTQVALEHRGRRCAFWLRALGAHQAWNAAAAVAAGIAAGVPFAAACRALRGHRPASPMRLQLLRLGPHRILHDAYNSNPQSAAAALAVMDELPCHGQRLLVAGSMLELGSISRGAHRDLGRLAAVSGVAGLIAVGREARWVAASALAAGVRRTACFADTRGVAARLRGWLSESGDLILVKGSRAIGLERVVEELKNGKAKGERREARGESRE